MLSAANQGSQTMAALDPNSMENRSGDGVSQGQAPAIASHYTWPASATQVAIPWTYGANSAPFENTTTPGLVHNYDPLRDSTASEGAQVAMNSVLQTPASSNLVATNGSQSYSGYVQNSSSTYAYGYGNIQYQSNYYGQPHQASYTPYQQAGASQNSGASYRPHSSFQNTGSYATPTCYSGAYFANDHQTAAGYPTSGYFNQTNYWNDGSGGGYPLQYASYPSSDTNSTPSTSNATTSSFPYQQECNQWSTNYVPSVTTVNYMPGSGGMVASTVPTVTYSFQNGVPLCASNQPPPPGTTSWRGDLGSSTLLAPQARNDVLSTFPHGSWEGKAPTEQNYYLTQIPSDLQRASESKLPFYENNVGSEKTTCVTDPSSSLQVFPIRPVSQNPQQPLQTSSTMDTCRVSKMQIPTNPRIASSLVMGMPKLDKETSTTNAAAKPAYISIQVPKLNNQLSSSDDADAVIKQGAFPPSVRAYVERCFSRCKDDAQRAANKLILSEIIAKAKDDGTLWTKNWDMEPLLPLPNSNSSGADQNTIPSLPKFPSRRIKSRWEPVAEEQIDPKVAPANNDSTKIIGWAERMVGSRTHNNMDNGRNSMKFPQQSLLSKTPQRPEKKSRFSDTANIIENGSSSSDSDKEQALTKHYSSAILLENSPEERKRREHRSKRFEKGQERQADLKQFKPKGAGVGNIYLRRANALMLAKSSDDQSTAVEDIYWDALTVKGTCQDVEKRYLRLTSAPDAATVRPEEVLEKALHMVQTSHRNYLYKCDQLKSIRQDLTVQRIQNELTVKVYETHGRLALEAGDLPEFNQCQSQLKRLYAEGIKGCQMEFSAYNLLCAILHSKNKRDLLSSMKSLSNEAKKDETVKNALAVHSAVSSGNYVLFFRLYNSASSLITSLMDLHVEKMRFEAMKCICKSYRPTVPVTYIAHVLGFSTSVKTGVDHENGANGLDECEEWLKAHGAVLTFENNSELQLDTKASSSTLYMPEPEDTVAHGDANLAVDDFFTRAS
ncbi:SAC3 family protein A isoform X4 [Phalaenopsis equestris]|uniref:SAC3 family protein A isoform X4 n=1 Tax=Phalaenopsis equestris TaxID=78828 RepID=UPI0009E23186|nr:SAC3 family protein A isoform X4 [Phalaenopsis equestris]